MFEHLDELQITKHSGILFNPPPPSPLPDAVMKELENVSVIPGFLSILKPFSRLRFGPPEYAHNIQRYILVITESFQKGIIIS